jgi:2-keto-4-pentenoate hydratase/2-oxohepta-3-ene-1,7-dioic acid hydratase in catechol pathway
MALHAQGFGDKVIFEAELGVVIGRECFQPARDSGDVIACGTSVGACFMQAGQQIEVRIPGLGSLLNRYSE